MGVRLVHEYECCFIIDDCNYLKLSVAPWLLYLQIAAQRHRAFIHCLI